MAAEVPPAAPYRLEVTVSPSCPASGVGALPLRKIVFDMGLRQEGPEWVLRLALGWEAEPSPSGYVVPNAGAVVLRFTAGAGGVTGTASGAGIAADAVHDVNFSASDSAAGDAQLVGHGTFEDGPLTGTLSGKVGANTYRLNDGGECAASDHVWSLAPG
jgi:hypothetical protein